MTEPDLKRYEKISLENLYVAMLDVAAKYRGFYSLLSAEEGYVLKLCCDTDKNRSVLVMTMCSGFYDWLDQIEVLPSHGELDLYRFRIDGRWYNILFTESYALESDPVCLAIWDETEQVWHARL